MDNEELILQLISGNETGYSTLIKMYHKRLFAYAMSLTNDQAMSEDIIQNVFLNLWQYRKRLNKDQSIKNFLYKSVYNEFLKGYNQRKSHLRIQQKYYEVLNEVVHEEEEPNLDLTIKLINEEINSLPKKCQEIFLLSKKDGLTNLEISEYLDISVKTVENQITKAYKVLRKNLNSKVHLFFISWLRAKIS